MISFITAFALLLIPILILLIVRVRRRQRIIYTHTFLQPLNDRPLREFLLRTFQLYYDVAADLLLALLLALFLSGVLDLSLRRVAVCLDGSFSMVQGQPESPLDRALFLLSEGELSGSRYRLFVAGFDPKTGRHKLYDLGRSGKRDRSVETLKERLGSLPGFFSTDPKAAAELFQRGYRRVIFLTDRYSGAGSALEVLEVGEGVQSFFYPLSAGYREEDGSFYLRVFRQRFTDPILIFRFDEEKDAYAQLYTIQPEAASNPVSEIRLEGEGLYRLAAGGLDFLLPLTRQILRVRAEGQFSALMADILPGVQPGSEGILLADIAWNPNEPGSLRRVVRNRHGILTLIPQTDDGSYLPLQPYIHSLRDSLSQPSYTELPRENLDLGGEADRVFFLDPSRIRDGGTPLVYLSALWSRRPDGPTLKPETLTSGAKLSPPRSGGTSFAYRISDRTVVINLPPEEFFLLPREQGFPLPSPAKQPPLPALLLMLLYLLKLLYLARLHGRTLFVSR